MASQSILVTQKIPEPEPTMELFGLAIKDSEAEDFGLKNVAAIDEDIGEECECVVIE